MPPPRLRLANLNVISVNATHTTYGQVHTALARERYTATNGATSPSSSSLQFLQQSVKLAARGQRSGRSRSNAKLQKKANDKVADTATTAP